MYKVLGAAFIVLSAGTLARAHFPFIVPDDKGATAKVVFSDTLEPDTNVNIEKIVTVEVAVFSVAGEKLVWAGRMRSEGPKSLRVFLDELVKVAASELKKQKVI